MMIGTTIEEVEVKTVNQGPRVLLDRGSLAEVVKVGNLVIWVSEGSRAQ